MDRDSWWRGVARACRLGWLLTFTAAYGLAQWADLTWASSAGGVPAVDLAAGIATGLLIRAESRILLALVVIQVALCASLDYLAGGTVVGLIWVVQQVAPPLSIALVMRAMSAGRITSPARLGLLVGAALTSTFVWSVGLALANAAAIGGGLPDGTWTAVWTSEMAGIVLVGPGLLAVTRSARWPLGRILEACVVAALTVSAALAFLATARDEVVLAWPAQGLLLPLFLWIALRFGLAAVSASVAVVEVAALTTMSQDVVSFAAGDSAGGSSVLPVVSATLVGVAVFAVALNEERRRLTSSRLLAARGVVDSLLANSDARISVKQYGHEGAGVYTLANPRFAASLRHSVPFIVGRADGDLLDAETAQREEHEDREVLAKQASRVFITRRPDLRGGRGGEILLVTKFPLADSEGRFRSVGSIALDITDHRRRERLMRLTFDQSPIPMARLGWRDGRAAEVLDANKSLGELLGLPVPELLVSRY